ncbi:EamA family transporter [Vibrio sp. Of7-15]|uniref:DMT family transporter n=1 Tax=Vibrio sp. Of7-15 TaxID=2724879 RepID=UPI001EF3C026|nr:EamA family transporter [Vibrio sp. Of7-15]MCG7498266.1 EamA family transporter [Vibrio sp. Of7-15]
MSLSIKPVTFMLVSTFNLSLSGLLAKTLTGVISVELLNLIRFLVPALIMLWLLLLIKWELPTKANIRPLLFRAFFITLTQLCFLYAINALSLVEAVVLFSTGPLFMPLLEKIIFRAAIRPITIVAIMIAFVGVVIQAGVGSGFQWRVELLIGLGSGLCNALSQVCMYRSSKSSLSALAVNTWCMVFATGLALPVFLMHSMVVNVDSVALFSALENPVFVLGAILMLSITVINTQMFRVRAYQLVESGTQLAPLIFTNLIFAFIWQVVFFEQALESHKIMGVMVIVSAIILNMLDSAAWLKKWGTYIVDNPHRVKLT